MTQLDNVNRALALIGTRSRLTVIDGSTTEGLYASLLYPMLKESMFRMYDPDWAMSEEGSAPFTDFPFVPSNWNFVWIYPTHAVRIRQAVAVVTDPFDPVPVEWNLHFDGSTRVILSKVPIAQFIYTRRDTSEDVWDSQFTDAFIRYFASAMMMALENRMEASEAILKEALAFGGMGNMRDD